MNKEYIKELKKEIAYAKKMIKKGDHVEERKRDIKDMQYELKCYYENLKKEAK